MLPIEPVLPIEVKFISPFLDDAIEQKRFHLTFIDALVKSQMFYRAAGRGTILYHPDPRNPEDLVPLTRISELKAVLQASLAVKIKGDSLSDEEWLSLCKAVLDNKFRIPSESLRPSWFPPVRR